MKDKELATMLTSVAGEYARRGWPKAAARVLRRRDSLVPKSSVYVWHGATSVQAVHWFCERNGGVWIRVTGDDINWGDAFADHEPDEDLDDMDPTSLTPVTVLPRYWSCE